MTTIETVVNNAKRMAIKHTDSRYGAARVNPSTLDSECDYFDLERDAWDYVHGSPLWAVARNNADGAEIIAHTPTSQQPAVSTPDPAPTPELAPLAALSDTELHERTEAAWRMLMAYLTETRRRAGVTITDDAIPF